MSRGPRLAGKVAIVTGGAGEVGLAAARRFAEEGARVVLSGRTEASLVAAAAATGGDAVSWFVADASVEDDNRALVQAALERHGRLDVLFANAGTEGPMVPIHKLALADFESVLRVNVIGPYLGIKHALPAIAAGGGGSIVVCGSIAGLKGEANMSAYNTSKHAVTGLVRAAAKEGAAKNVRVNSLNPGPLQTRMMAAIESGQVRGGDGQVFRDAVLRTIPLGRYGRVEEVAEAALFLASDESSYITGAVLPVEGGATA
jgi:NAD(P)-dependent dehydrogenase (short-subunit alcohol dehydrogenase family)